MDQKTPFIYCPEDILERLFGFFDALTLIEVAQVNKAWSAMAIRLLSSVAFKHYNTKTPHALIEGRLLNALCDWFEPSRALEDCFSANRQTLFFTQFVKDVFKDVFGEVIDGSETLLQFIKRLSDSFPPDNINVSDNDWSAIRSLYLKNNLEKTPRQIEFLFNADHTRKFLKLYDRKTKTAKITTNDQCLFLAKYLQNTQELESFLITLVLFAARKNNQDRKLIKLPYYSGLLTGDGLLALSSFGYALVSALIDKWLEPNKPDPPLSLQEVQFFLAKLHPADLISYIRVESYKVDKAICGKQPQIIALLSSGSMASDTALIHFLNKNSYRKYLLDSLENIPELALRLKNPLFLHRLLVSSIFPDNRQKMYFSIEILCRLFFVADLQETEIFSLAEYLHFGSPDELAKILPSLFIANKLTGSLLLKLAKLESKNDYYSGNYISIIAADAQACAVFAKKENAPYAFAILKIALESTYSQYQACALLSDPAVMQNFTLKQVQSLYASAKPINQSLLHKWLIEKLPDEPNDALFIEYLFIYTSFDTLGPILNTFPKLVARLAQKGAFDLFYQRCVSFYESEEKIDRKKQAASLLVRPEFILQLDDLKIIWLTSVLDSSRFDELLDLIFAAKQVNQNLLLTLTRSPHFVSYALSASSNPNRAIWLIQDQRFVFCVIRCVLTMSPFSLSDGFIVKFSSVIEQFTIDNWVRLLDVVADRNVQQSLQTILLKNSAKAYAVLEMALQPNKTKSQPYPLLNNDLFIKQLTLEQLYSFWCTAVKKNKERLEVLFVSRLVGEPSVQVFTTCLVQENAINRVMSWCTTYPALLRRLQQPDVYPFVWEKCVAFLTEDKQLLKTNLGTVDKNTLNWLKLLPYLQCPPTFDERQKRATLKQYSSEEIYRLCLQLRTIEDDASQSMFYPLCLDFLNVADLQKLKQHFSSKIIEDYLFSNDVITSIDKVVTQKVRAGEAATVGECCRYAIPSLERNWIFVLLFLGIGGVIAGAVSGLAIVSMIALIPMLCGVGMALIPICSALLSRLTFSSDADISHSDQEPTSHIPYSKLWFGVLIGLFVLGFVVTAPILSAVHGIVFFAIGVAALASIASVALFFVIAYALIPAPNNTFGEGIQCKQNTVKNLVDLEEDPRLPALQGQHKTLFSADKSNKDANKEQQSSEKVLDGRPHDANSLSISNG